MHLGRLTRWLGNTPLLQLLLVNIYISTLITTVDAIPAGTINATDHSLKLRSVGGPGRAPDAYIIVLVDGTNLDSHLYWLYNVIAANGGTPNPLPPYLGGPNPSPGDGSGGPGSGSPGDGSGAGPGSGSPGDGSGSGPGGSYPGGGSGPGSGSPGDGSGSGPGGSYPGGGSGPGSGSPGGPGSGSPGDGSGSGPGGSYPGGGSGPGGGSPGGPGSGSPGDGSGGGPGSGSPGDGSGGYPGGPGSGSPGNGSGGGPSGSYPGVPDGNGNYPGSPGYEYPGPIPCPGNTTPYQTGTADGDGAGPSSGIFDGMGMYAGIFPGVIKEALLSNPDVSGVYADSQGFIAINQAETIVHPRFEEADEEHQPSHQPGMVSRLFSRTPERRGKPTIVKQKGAAWNLVRMAYRKPPKAGTANASLFAYNSTAGAGVDIYVLDTGIFLDHSDFGGRAKWGKTVPSLAGKTTDDNGHGTHLAAIAAGSRYGVAKGANLVAVKVASDSGGAYASDIVAGIHWTIKAVKTSKKPSIISLSLGSGVNGALDAAAEKAVKKGIHFVAAAGNDGGDGSAHSPGRSEKVVTVGAIDSKDGKAAFSNNGAAVKIWAPGVGIASAWLGRPDSTATLSGTSMAAPHISGLIAYVIGLYGNQKPSEIMKWLAIASTNNTVGKLSGDDHNQMAFNCWSETCYTFPTPKPSPSPSPSASSSVRSSSMSSSVMSFSSTMSSTEAPTATPPPPPPPPPPAARRALPTQS